MSILKKEAGISALPTPASTKSIDLSGLRILAKSKLISDRKLPLLYVVPLFEFNDMMRFSLITESLIYIYITKKIINF
jgi:hypothetical protein